MAGASLEKGKTYVLRRVAEIDEFQFATSVLPRALHEAGAVVDEAPRVATDFIHPYIGEPLFVVRFTLNGIKGLVVNSGDFGKDGGSYTALLILTYGN